MHPSVGSAIGRAARPGLFLFISPLTSQGFPVGALWLAVRAINLAKVEMNGFPAPCPPPVEHTWLYRADHASLEYDPDSFCQNSLIDSYRCCE